MDFLTNILVTLITLSCVVKAEDVEYILEGEIFAADESGKCITHYGVRVPIDGLPCMTLEVTNTSTAGVFILPSHTTSEFVNVATSLLFNPTTATELRFSSGTQALTEASDLINPEAPFFILKEDEDPTSPSNCVDVDTNQYDTCSPADTFYITPSDCEDASCSQCIPDPAVCVSCIDGKAVREGSCVDCDAAYGANCVQCNNTECSNCDGDKVLKANATISTACTDPCDASVENCAHCDTMSDTCSECIEGFDLELGCADVTTTAASRGSATYQAIMFGISYKSLLLLLAVII